MAVIKNRLLRKTAAGGYDSVHLETSSDLVIRPSGSLLETDLVSLTSQLASKASATHLHDNIYSRIGHTHSFNIQTSTTLDISSFNPFAVRRGGMYKFGGYTWLCIGLNTTAEAFSHTEEIVLALDHPYSKIQFHTSALSSNSIMSTLMVKEMDKFLSTIPADLHPYLVDQSWQKYRLDMASNINTSHKVMPWVDTLNVYYPYMFDIYTEYSDECAIAWSNYITSSNYTSTPSQLDNVRTYRLVRPASPSVSAQIMQGPSATAWFIPCIVLRCRALRTITTE